MLFRKLMLISILAMLLSACASVPMPVVDADADDTPVVEEKPLESTEVPVDSNETISEQTVVDALRPGVLKELGLADDAELELVSYEQVTWNDTSMGCPEPDMMYAQVLSPGYLVVFSHGGESIEVHASGKLNDFVMCDSTEAESNGENVNDAAVPLLPQAAESQHPGVILALEEMVTESKVDAEKISVLEISEETWPNSCLGCADKEEMCLAVLTPGYRVTLIFGEDIYEFHTSVSKIARLCGVTKQ